MSERKRRPKTPIVISFLMVAFLAWVWIGLGDNRQFQIMGTYLAFLLGSVSLAVWALLFSGWGWQRRVAPAAILAAVVVVTLLLVRVRGVTGDWLPVWEWRFGDGGAQVAAGDAGAAAARDFTGFLGSQRDSTVQGVELLTDWEAHPPTKVWQQPIGAGWAGFAIGGDVAYTLEQRDEHETVVAYRLGDGSEFWSHARAARFSNPIAGPGPRTTPALSETTVFALGAEGDLWALARDTGEVLWHHDIVEETGASLPEHGKSSSPLLTEGLVVVSAGGGNGKSMVAYRQDSGEEVWSAGSDGSSYSSPVVAQLGGLLQVVSLNASSISGIGVEDGSLLWRMDYPGNWPNVAPPLVLGADRVLFSTGYGIGSRLVRVGEASRATGTQTASTLWESPRLKAKFTNLVLHEGYVYGLDDGVLVCLDPETGDRVWKRGRYGHGNILLVGDHLLVQTERGDMVLVEASPEEHRELGRFTALRGKAWNPFAFAPPYLLVRNDQEMALWSLPLATQLTWLFPSDVRLSRGEERQNGAESGESRPLGAF